MAKTPDIKRVATGYDMARAINENFEEVVEAFRNVISRDGSLPNHMNADFDMNGQDILNVDTIDVKDLAIQGTSLKELLDAIVAAGEEAKEAADEANSTLESLQTFGQSDLEMMDVEVSPKVNMIFRLPKAFSPDQVAPINVLTFWRRVEGGTSEPYFTTKDGSVWVQTGYDDRKVLSTIYSAIVAIMQNPAVAGVQPFPSLAAFNSASIPSSVTRVHVQGVGAFRRGTSISGIKSGWVPDGEWSLSHFGVVGSGDETTKVQNAFNATFNRKLFGINGSSVTISGVTIPPQNISWVSNGQIFRKANASSTAGITIQGNFSFDEVLLTVPSGSTDRGIRVVGSNVKGGILSAKADSAIGGVGVHFEASVAGQFRGNYDIKKVETSNYATQQHYVRIENSSIHNLVGKTYVVGAYFIDCVNSHFDNGDFSVKHPTSTGAVGSNGFLLEGTSNDVCGQLWFNDWSITNAGEHSYRIGGQYRINDVWIVNPKSSKSGAGGATAVGGAGIKVLGPTTVNNPRHRNINVVDAVVEDCSTIGSGLGNFCGFDMGNIDGLFLSGIVRAKDETYSCWDGVLLNNVSNVKLDAQLLDCRRWPIRTLADAANVADVAVCENWEINATCHTKDVDSGSACVTFWNASETVRDGLFKNITGRIKCSGGIVALRTLDITTGSGGYRNVRLDVEYSDPSSTAGGPPLQGGNVVVVNYYGPVYGTFGSSAADGSTQIDAATGDVKSRVGGLWASPSYGADLYFPSLAAFNSATIPASTQRASVSSGGQVVDFTPGPTIEGVKSGWRPSGEASLYHWGGLTQTALDAAIKGACRDMGVVLNLPGGAEISMSANLPVYNFPVRLAGDPANRTKLKWSNAGIGLSVSSPSVATGVSVTANAGIYSRTLTLSSAAGIQVGDLAVMTTTRKYETAPAGQGVFCGEVSVVTGVSGNVITLADPINDSYTTADAPAVNVYRPLHGVSISGVDFEKPDGTNECLRVSYAYRPSVTECGVKKAGNAGVTFAYCYEPEMSGVDTALVRTTPSYALRDIGSVRATFSRCSGVDNTKTIDITGLLAPSRGASLVDCWDTVTSVGAGGGIAFGSHWGAERVLYDRLRFDGFRSMALNLRGKDETARDCVFSGPLTDAVLLVENPRGCTIQDVTYNGPGRDNAADAPQSFARVIAPDFGFTEFSIKGCVAKGLRNRLVLLGTADKDYKGFSVTDNRLETSNLSTANTLAVVEAVAGFTASIKDFNISGNEAVTDAGQTALFTLGSVAYTALSKSAGDAYKITSGETSVIRVADSTAAILLAGSAAPELGIVIRCVGQKDFYANAILHSDGTLTSLGAVSNVVARAGSMSGTTGTETAGKLAVSFVNSRIFIQNRTGVEQTVAITVGRIA